MCLLGVAYHAYMLRVDTLFSLLQVLLAIPLLYYDTLTCKSPSYITRLSCVDRRSKSSQGWVFCIMNGALGKRKAFAVGFFRDVICSLATVTCTDIHVYTQ